MLESFIVRNKILILTICILTLTLSIWICLLKKTFEIKVIVWQYSWECISKCLLDLQRNIMQTKEKSHQSLLNWRINDSSQSYLQECKWGVTFKSINDSRWFHHNQSLFQNEWPPIKLGIQSAEGKGILTVGTQGISQSHTKQQTSHERFIGRNTRVIDCLGEKQQSTEQEAGFKSGFLYE